MHVPINIISVAHLHCMPAAPQAYPQAPAITLCRTSHKSLSCFWFNGAHTRLVPGHTHSPARTAAVLPPCCNHQPPPYGCHHDREHPRALLQKSCILLANERQLATSIPASGSIVQAARPVGPPAASGRPKLPYRSSTVLCMQN